MTRLPGSEDVLADPEGFWRFQGLTLIAGVDEVGRGPLAGPVVAAAVILPAGVAFPGLRDSKRLSPEIRLELDGHIRRQALALAIREVGPRRIEQQGILAASLRAMAQAIRDLALVPEMVLVDGNQPLPLTYPQQAVIKGDDRCPSIAAASVVAKVYRDRLMEAPAPTLPPVQLRPAQGLRHRRAPGGPALLGPLRPPPPHLSGGEGVAGRRGMMSGTANRLVYPVTIIPRKAPILSRYAFRAGCTCLARLLMGTCG